MRDDLMAIFKLDPECRVRQEFLHNTGKFEQFLFGHDSSCFDCLIVRRGDYVWRPGVNQAPIRKIARVTAPGPGKWGLAARSMVKLSRLPSESWADRTVQASAP